ncbi:hypothetical protein [Kitasatospora sp. NPDC005856]|uniref:hypothetical protein n=1 Tax=Kitasatospora sp. NPDC005856 TaxID=3154566 RepID=UPI0033DDBD20
MVDAGAIITPPGQYTHCVDRADYEVPPGPLDAGVPSILAFMLCDYLLGGKLVCLAGGGDECAIGVVVGLEQARGKSGIEAIDNDFSFNLLLAPFQTDDFAKYSPPGTPDPDIVDPHRVRDDAAANGPLGRLLKDSPNPRPLPAPLDRTGIPIIRKPLPQGTATYPVDGYGVLWKLAGTSLADDGREGDNLHKLWDQPSDTDWHAPPRTGRWVPLPVLHAECEGSRIFFVCQALKPFLDILRGKPPGGGPSPGEVCHAVAEDLPWPLDKALDAVCSIVEDLVALVLAVLLAPAMLAAAAAAWEAAQAFDDAFVTGPVARQIKVGDVLIVQGRWVWDAGHSGHTELHPVKAIVKLTTPAGQLPAEVRPAPAGYDPRTNVPAADRATITATQQRWCRLVNEAPPPPDPRNPDGLTGAQLGSLTPAQLAVLTAQQRPENSWTVHPLIDGCAPGRPPAQPG